MMARLERVVGVVVWNIYHARLFSLRDWSVVAGVVTMIALALYVVARGVWGVLT